VRRIGIDVGGTNTDAVLLDDGRIVHAIKTPTTQDVTSGIVTALDMLGRHPEVAEVEAFGERLHATLRGVPAAEVGAARERLARHLTEGGVTVESARAMSPSLEDIFIARIRAAEARS